MPPLVTVYKQNHALTNIVFRTVTAPHLVTTSIMV